MGLCPIEPAAALARAGFRLRFFKVRGRSIIGSSAGCGGGAPGWLRLLPGVVQAVHLRNTMCLSAFKVHCEDMTDSSSADAVLRPETHSSSSTSHNAMQELLSIRQQNALNLLAGCRRKPPSPPAPLPYYTAEPHRGVLSQYDWYYHCSTQCQHLPAHSCRCE